MWPFRATITLHASADSPTAMAAAAYAAIEPIDEHSCLLRAGAESPRGLAFLLGAIDVDFHIHDAPELAEELHLIADRFHRASE